ncbi:hypothetical protein M9H77_27144 [Catharanthus roseus]|uniref:Uncharacterized protein n=1 Tax=Catharanthus roseus TaxID=4058 RepID=A0ACC0AFT1_CATRO|nr:hypothetical protein M9H77_27144 [Catharanthus roseus]
MSLSSSGCPNFWTTSTFFFLSILFSLLLHCRNTWAFSPLKDLPSCCCSGLASVVSLPSFDCLTDTFLLRRERKRAEGERERERERERDYFLACVRPSELRDCRLDFCYCLQCCWLQLLCVLPNVEVVAAITTVRRCSMLLNDCYSSVRCSLVVGWIFFSRLQVKFLVGSTGERKKISDKKEEKSFIFVQQWYQSQKRLQLSGDLVGDGCRSSRVQHSRFTESVDLAQGSLLLLSLAFSVAQPVLFVDLL